MAGRTRVGDREWPPEVVEVLRRHLPESIADTVLSQVADRCAHQDWGVPGDRETLIAALARAAGVFLRGAQMVRCREELARVGRPSAECVRGARFHHSVAQKQDVAEARLAAIDFARAWGASERVAARVGTVVSELASNIATYAIEGDVVGRCDGEAFHLIASDRGPGIANLADVLSGKYQSPDSLGMGLLGVKRLAGELEVMTVLGEGTTVTVRVELGNDRRVSA